MAKRVTILAGGTGGHIFPALAVAHELQARGVEVRWMGTRAGMEARVVPAADIPIDWLAVTGFRGKSVWSRLQAPFKLALACLQAGSILRRTKPNLVLGMGGFVAGPGGIMARLLGIPLVIHEQNRIPGTTNRMLVKWAQVVLEAFPASFPASVNARWVGNPLRRELTQEIPAARALIQGQTLKVLVLGGSQGAKALNQMVPKAIANLQGSVQVWHQTGEAMRSETEALYNSLGLEARVAAFIDDMAAAYRWADLAVCRAGAMTLSELMASGLPSLLVPYPYAIDDHQTANAHYLADAGAAVLLPQDELSPEQLAQELNRIIHDPALIAVRSQRTLELAKLNATQQVADVCLTEARP